MPETDIAGTNDPQSNFGMTSIERWLNLIKAEPRLKAVHNTETERATGFQPQSEAQVLLHEEHYYTRSTMMSEYKAC